jgi:squalene-hopene/tetraprenyl-beta-curcumene cyclase
MVQAELSAGRSSNGCWAGESASSPLATATAISALVLVHGGDRSQQGIPAMTEDPIANSLVFQSDLSELLVESLHWLAQQQNTDGGWGDTNGCPSSLATTLVVRSAFQLTGVPARYTELVAHCDRYISEQGGFADLRRRNGKDKSFVAPVLATCALAELVPWRQVPALPFELVCLPRTWMRWLRLPVASCAIPLMIAIGQSRFAHRNPANPILRAIRRASWNKSTAILEQMQAANGSYLGSVAWTSFVAMSLASTGRAEHPVARRAVEYLLATLRPNGSWPLQTGLPVRNTALAVDALVGDAADFDTSHDENSDDAWSPYDSRLAVPVSKDSNGNGSATAAEITSSAVGKMDGATYQWLMTSQQKQRDAVTGAEPGGWSWTDEPGGVPTAMDTAAVLLALAHGRQNSSPQQKRQIQSCASEGIHWLLKLQNNDGGWPTFCQGWTWLAADQSAADVTALVLRALAKWRSVSQIDGRYDSSLPDQAARDAQLAGAITRGLAFLEAKQHADGYWLPLWAGNALHASGENRVWGTSLVLLLCAEIGELEGAMVRRAANWLASVQHQCGGWGPTRTDPPLRRTASRDKAAEQRIQCRACSMEETSLAVAALLPLVKDDERCQRAAERGLAWLIEAVGAGRLHEPAPINACLGRMLYSEWLYPQIFATAALGRAMQLVPGPLGGKRPVVCGISK